MNDPFVCDDDLTIELPDGYRLFISEMDDTPRQRGGRDDGPTQAKLKDALRIEAYLTYCKFQVIDIRAGLPQLYSERARQSPDERSAAVRDADARTLLDGKVGTYTVQTCIDEGRKRAPRWFNMDAAALKEYMQTTHLAYSRAAEPGIDDTAIMEAELSKLWVLAHAVNRAAENRENQKWLLRETKRKRQRKQLYTVNPFPFDKYAFPPLTQAYQLAHHSGVDPTDLWPRWRRFSPFFKLIVLNGFDARRQPIGREARKDIRKIFREVMPYLDGYKFPEDEITWSLLRILGIDTTAHERFKERFGFEFAGPHGPAI